MGGLTFTPTKLHFGHQTIGTTSGTQTVTVINYLSYPVNIASIASTGDFQETNTCGGSVGGNSTCTINVTFKPTTSGALHGALFFQFYMGPTVLPMPIALSGMGD